MIMIFHVILMPQYGVELKMASTTFKTAISGGDNYFYYIIFNFIKILVN